jgi:UPF0176 protein
VSKKVPKSIKQYIGKALIFLFISVGEFLIEENEIKIGDKILIRTTTGEGINYRGNVSE